MNESAAPMLASSAAPSRKRRHWYWIGGFVLLIFLTPVLVTLIASWWSERQLQALYAEIDAEDPDWRWPDLVAASQLPAGEVNSADQIAKVRGLLMTKSFNLPPKWDRDANQKTLDQRNARLNLEQGEMLRAAFAKLDPRTLPEARKLKDMPNGHFPLNAADNLFTMRWEWNQHVREVMSVLSNDAMLRGDEGDHDGAIESCQALVNTARSLRGTPTLIGLLVRVAGHAIAHGAIERALGQGEASEASLKKLQESLEAEIADDGLHQAMRGERALGQRMFEDMRDGKIPISRLAGTPGATPKLADRVFDLFSGFILASYPEYLGMMNHQVKIAKLKDEERAEAFRKVDAKLREGRLGILARQMLPAITKVHEANRRSQAMLRASVVAVAAERYRLKHERWPSGMKELIQDSFIKDAYTDPYDGKPLRIKRTATGLIVYTIGMDQTDDGGKLNRAAPTTAGCDIGFELWDPPMRRVPSPEVLPDGN